MQQTFLWNETVRKYPCMPEKLSIYPYLSQVPPAFDFAQFHLCNAAKHKKRRKRSSVACRLWYNFRILHQLRSCCRTSYRKFLVDGGYNEETLYNPSPFSCCRKVAPLRKTFWQEYPGKITKVDCSTQAVARRRIYMQGELRVVEIATYLIKGLGQMTR